MEYEIVRERGGGWNEVVLEEDCVFYKVIFFVEFWKFVVKVLKYGKMLDEGMFFVGVGKVVEL